MEWDDLGDWERRRRISLTFGLGMIFSIIFSVFAAAVYFVLRLLHLPRLALATALVMIAFPFVGIMAHFCIEILLSKWRTHFSKP
jgi:O-antigen/teichoic acid export membrane protein